MSTKYFFITYILFFVFSTNFISHSEGFTGKYPIQNFLPIDYKAGIQNIDFAQNRDMTLFVANNLGVLSYNGNSWEKHNFKTGKKQRSLAFDENSDRLYVGSQGEFGYFEKAWNYVSLTGMIPSEIRDFDEVWDVFILNSKIYFCTFQRIYVFDGKSITSVESTDGFNRSFLANGKLFTQSRTGKLLEIKNDKLVQTYPQKLKNEIISGVISQDDGYVIFYNSGQIEYSSAFEATTMYDELSDALKGKFVNHVMQLSDARLAISTQTSGLFLYDPKTKAIEIISIEDGLKTNACLRSFQDYTGNLWVGMQNGMALIHINSPIRLINQSVNLQGSGYDAFQTDKGTYYTTSNGIYFLPKGSSSSIFLKGSEGPAYSMQEIAGKLYAGHHSGLFLLEGGKAKRVATSDGLWKVSQLRSSPEYAIAGTYSGLYLFKLDNNKRLQPIQKIEGFNESSRFFEEDKQGNIIVGQYYKGLFKLAFFDDLTKVRNVDEPGINNFPINDQIILGKIDNELLIGTNEGLYQMDQETKNIIESKSFSSTIGKQPIYIFKQDKEKNIHFVSDESVGFFKPISVSNYVFVPSSLFESRYNLNNDLLNVSDNIESGIMYSANEGFIQYNPSLENRINLEVPILLRKIISVTEDSIIYMRNPFDEKQEDSKTLEVSYRDKVLQFHIESFQYTEAKSQQFRYYLNGFDDKYGEWTNSTVKEYTNLKEGKYEFQVQSRNYLGELITSRPFLIKVNPPFNRSIYAKTIYVGMGILSLFLLSAFQKRKYESKAKLIEDSKKLELAEKQEKLVNIRREKDNELSLLKEENMRNELIQLNNLLASSTMNLVVKNEFIENIKGDLKEVKKKGKNQAMIKEIERIEKGIDSTLRLQEDWEQFEHHFDQVHGDFLNRLRQEFIDLGPNDQKLCVFLRLNLNTKEIANLMGISTRGIEIARYRLRKKLELKKGVNLSKFILEF